MSYNKQSWVDESPVTPVRYKIVDDATGTIANSASIEVTSDLVQGSPLTGARMAHIEDGIYDADAAATTAAAAAAAAQSTANTAITNAATAQTTANNAIPKNTVTVPGDLMYCNSVNSVTRLGISNNYKTLRTVSDLPAWSAVVGACMSRSTAQSIANNTPTVISFNTDEYDNGGFLVAHRITIPAGRPTQPYLFVAGGSFDGGYYGARTVGIRVNGSTGYYSRTNPQDASVASWLTVTAVVVLVPGDYVEMVVTQTEGSSLNFNNARLSVLQF